MSILSSLFGNYADDLAKAAAKAATKNAGKEVAENAAKTASKAILSQADDAAKAGAKTIGKNIDDVLPTTSSRLTTALNAERPNTFKSTMVGGIQDMLNSGGDDAASVLEMLQDETGALSNESLKKLKSNVKGYVDDVKSLKSGYGFNKSELPKIRTSDYVKYKGISGEDIPAYMKNHLSKDGLSLMDNAWGDYLPRYTSGGQFNGDIDDILNLYEKAEEGLNANAKVMTEDNVRDFFNAYPEAAEQYEQELARSYNLGNQKIDVNKAYGKTNVPVKIGSKEVAEPANVVEATEIALPATSKKATKATATQKLASKDRLKYAADLGASAKQREELFRNYRLGDKGTTIGDYLKNQNVTLANIKDRSEAALNAFSGVKNDLLSMADDAGIMIDMPSLVGANSSALKKADLNMIKNTLGIDLENDILNTAMKPSEAEALYTQLRNRAFAYQKSDTTKAAGKALQDAVADLGNAIDDSLESIKGTYGLTKKTADAASQAGLGYDEIRNIVGKGDKFSVRDLRTLQQPWVVARDMVANKAPKEATLNIAGIDTGLPNLVKKTTEGVGDIPLKAAAFAEKNPKATAAAMLGAGLVGGSLLGNLMSGGGQSASQNYGMGADQYGANALSQADIASLTGQSTASQEPSINGWTMDDLETAYFNATLAGDSDAAKVAASMMDVLSNRTERLQEASKNSGIASKQKAAINVLNNLMNNFQAKGVVGGNLGQFFNMLSGGGYDPQQYAYDTGSKGSLGSIIKALGDTGALSEGDQQRALQLLPSTTDTQQAAQIKYQQLLQILQGAGAQ